MNSKLNSTWRYLLAYLAWAIVLALAVWFLLLSRDAFLGLSSVLYVGDSTIRARQIRSLDKFYTLGVGIACLIITIVSEFYFRKGVRRGNLLPRFARVLGFELLLILVADALLLSAQGWGMATWSRWLILGTELALGILLLIVGRSAPAMLSDLTRSDSDSTAFS